MNIRVQRTLWARKTRTTRRMKRKRARCRGIHTLRPSTP
jgi:hypothetical protein